MNLLFLISAQGGSNGPLSKNLAHVSGILFVGRAARVARLAERVLGSACRVVCSTDDPAIAQVTAA